MSKVVSNCCGANIPQWPDYDFCRDCKEHCGAVCEACGRDLEYQEESCNCEAADCNNGGGLPLP